MSKKILYVTTRLPYPLIGGDRLHIYHYLSELKKRGHEITLVTLVSEDDDLDGLNYLAGRTVDYINKQAMNGTVLAHVDGEIPNLMITVPYMSEFNLGELFYFFEFACGVSGYVLGVNPFNQPGVESYKKNMFALLGKPGFEEQRKVLLERMKKEK